MLDLPAVKDLATRTAAAIYGRSGVGIRDVRVEPYADLDGKDALRLTVVFARGTYQNIGEADSTDTLGAILRDLQRAGDDRFPFMRFTTEEELESVDDSEC